MPSGNWTMALFRGGPLDGKSFPTLSSTLHTTVIYLPDGVRLTAMYRAIGKVRAFGGTPRHVFEHTNLIVEDQA